MWQSVSHVTGYISLVTAPLDFVQVNCPNFQNYFKPTETPCFISFSIPVQALH